MFSHHTALSSPKLRRACTVGTRQLVEKNIFLLQIYIHTNTQTQGKIQIILTLNRPLTL